MAAQKCNSCGRDIKREFGFFTAMLVVLSLGLWLLALPFYPKKCSVCNSNPESILHKINSNFPPGAGAVVAIAILIIIAITNHKGKSNALKTEQDIELDAITCSQVIIESEMAPTKVKFNQFKAVPKKDKNGNPVKDVWEVTGNIDFQNSFGAMVRSKYYAKIKRTGEEYGAWKALQVKVGAPKSGYE